ncbi:type II toxin-antitoxin system HicB family antitoxin [Castellaniella denitrificans]|uniref:type II toxin-antitoxin system HicB family antitoxin n=1 Tax=Castellaniella denitrificans TaxID=56119 RepID=UPI00361A9AC4
MKYPIAIEPGNETTAWSVVVPDLPGCFSAADEGIDEAVENAREAIALWIEDSIEHNEPIPQPSRITDLQKLKVYEGWIWAIVEVDPALMDDTTERVNITLPRRILKRLDDRARAAGESRSGYIAHLALLH